MPTSVLVKCNTGLAFNAPATAPTSVTSRPSRIHVTPSATTTSVWNRPQGSRSRRAGMSDSMMALSAPVSRAASSVAMGFRSGLRQGLNGLGDQSFVSSGEVYLHLHGGRPVDARGGVSPAAVAADTPTWRAE